MFWESYTSYAIISLLSWGIAILVLSILLIYDFFYNRKLKVLNFTGHLFIVIGISAITFFLIKLWINLERPPMRTLGETRLWYTFFLASISYIIYLRWRYKVVIIGGLFFAILFLLINYFNPETYDKTLMPALQSVWFVPHVIVYILSYAILALSTLIAIIGLVQTYTKKFKEWTITLADNLVYIGFAFLTLGLLFGALWAKEAWGHYWTWDPKETWAFVTWMGYMLYMHFRYFQPEKIKAPLWILTLAFVFLLICWFGINYLPSAQNSVHTYTQ